MDLRYGKAANAHPTTSVAAQRDVGISLGCSPVLLAIAVVFSGVASPV
jgi:hypothetical protein